MNTKLNYNNNRYIGKVVTMWQVLSGTVITHSASFRPLLIKQKVKIKKKVLTWCTCVFKSGFKLLMYKASFLFKNINGFSRIQKFENNQMCINFCSKMNRSRV